MYASLSVLIFLHQVMCFSVWLLLWFSTRLSPLFLLAPRNSAVLVFNILPSYSWKIPGQQRRSWGHRGWWLCSKTVTDFLDEIAKQSLEARHVLHNRGMCLNPSGLCQSIRGKSTCCDQVSHKHVNRAQISETVPLSGTGTAHHALPGHLWEVSSAWEKLKIPGGEKKNSPNL